MLPMTARVFQMIRRSQQPLSKAELADRTGVSLSSVSVHVERLQEEGLIALANIGASSGGRKPKQYAIDKDYGLILSIELGSSSFRAAVADFDCGILCSETADMDVKEDPDKVLTTIHRLAERLLKRQGFDKGAVKGIGIGIPGPVDFSLGLPISPPLMPGWDHYPIREFWSKHYDCPCYVDNDVNIMALGEFSKGLNYEVDNLIFVKIGTGIGSGIIQAGTLYRGATGSAGDIGHFDTGSDAPCWCGNRGCLEAVAGGKAIVARAAERAGDGESGYLSSLLRQGHSPTLADIGAGLLELDPVSVEAVRQSGAVIGKALASIVNFANPSLISLGGRVAAFGDIFLAAIRQGVYRRSLPLATRNLQINRSRLGESAGIVGGAFMTVDQLIVEATDDSADLFP